MQCYSGDNMKRTLYLMIALFLLCPAIVSADDAASYLPGNFFPIGAYLPSDYWVSQQMMPMGWSRDGRIAFVLLQHQNDGRGAAEYRFIVFDAVEDVYLYDHKVVPDDAEDFDIDDDAFEYAWKKGFVEFEIRLKAFDIVPLGRDGDSGLETFPVTARGNEFDSEVVLDPPLNNDEDKSSALRNYILRVNRGDGRTKTSTRGNSLRMKRGTVCGYLKSPFEERILIVYGLDMYVPDWEAMPNPDGSVALWMTEFELEFSGSHLLVGFQ